MCRNSWSRICRLEASCILNPQGPPSVFQLGSQHYYRPCGVDSRRAVVSMNNMSHRRKYSNSSVSVKWCCLLLNARPYCLSAALCPSVSLNTSLLSSSLDSAKNRLRSAKMAKPTVVVLPGAWIPLAGYATILRELRASCYQAQITAYPSLDPADPSKADCAADAIHIVENALKPLIEQDGKDVLLVMHSYASMPGIAAAKGYSKAQRVSGNKKGGVIGLVCLSAFLVPEGVSCSGAQGGSLPPWILLDTVSLEHRPAGHSTKTLIFRTCSQQRVSVNPRTQRRCSAQISHLLLLES